MEHLKIFNDYSGLFLMLIAIAAWTAIRMLAAIGTHIECMHEDHAKVTHAHDIES
jgi:hypothetical protein